MSSPQPVTSSEGPGEIWWPSADIVLKSHIEIMSWHRNPPSPCDRAKLEGALYRPQAKHVYEKVTDIVVLAVTLALAIAQAHSFVDGNKRTAYAALVLFMKGNGYEVTTGTQDESIAKYIEKIVIALHESECRGEEVLNEFCRYLRSVTISL